jgi:hypothetical protein
VSDVAGKPAAAVDPAPEAAPVPIPPGVSIANHPRARGAIRRTRARAGLAGFALVLLLALNAGVPAADAVVRALAAGLAAFLCGWAIALMWWKQVLLAELRAAHERREVRRRALAEAAAARHAERLEAERLKAAAGPPA